MSTVDKYYTPTTHAISAYSTIVYCSQCHWRLKTYPQSDFFSLVVCIFRTAHQNKNQFHVIFNHLHTLSLSYLRSPVISKHPTIFPSHNSGGVFPKQCLNMFHFAFEAFFLFVSVYFHMLN